MPKKRRLPPRLVADTGAAAVEFALVLPILLAILMGIVDYGLWFNDSLSARQGVREAAREAVVRHQPSNCSGTGMEAVACDTRQQILGTGSAYAKVFAPNGWVKGEELVVCGMTNPAWFTSFVPLPAGGWIRSETLMSIETVTPPPSNTSYTDTPPSGTNWTWCTG